LLFFTKPLDDYTPKLREFSLQILKNLYNSGKCKGVKDKLEKIRFIDVIGANAIEVKVSAVQRKNVLY
jgi:uncharacterized protein YnzC (UPF0291/DUF896 family)